MESEKGTRESLLSHQQEDQQLNTQKFTRKYMQQLQNINGKSLFQVIFFTWLHPFLSYGNRIGVTLNVMPRLPQNLTTQIEYNRIFNSWLTTEKSHREGFTLVKIFFKSFKKDWMISLFVLIFCMTTYMLRPFATSLSIDYIQNHQGDIRYGIGIFFLIFLITFINQVTFTHLLYRFTLIGLNLANGLTMLIYCKSLKYSSLASKQFSQAQIINFSQVDAERLTYMGHHIAAFFYGPFQIVGGLIMMYWFVGYSFLFGLAMIIILFGISFFSSKKTILYNQKVLKAKDERMKVTEQMLDIIRFIKISSIQKFFFKKLDDKRNTQIGYYVKKGIFDVLTNVTFWMTCPMLLTATFLAYTYFGFQMSSEVAFTTIMIATIIEYPIYSLPTAISEVIQIMSSVRRIQKFLMTEDINNSHINYDHEDESIAIKISNGNFYWEKETDQKKGQKKGQKKSEKNQKLQDKNQVCINQEDDDLSDVQNNMASKIKQLDKQNNKLIKQIHALRDINVTIQKDKLIMIIGDIGSGKSSFLMAILNEMIKSPESTMSISGQLAYASQKPWIMSGTLRDNITFTLPYDQQKFKKVIYFSSLEQDIKMFPKGDQTEIGQKGINISGGQKARVSLARVLYSQKDILLLDDILSAVDVHVGEFILKETLKGYCKGKTIIIPTHAIKFVAQADEIIVMKKGRIVKKGHYKDISGTAEYQEICQHEAEKQKIETQEVKQHKEEASLEAELMMIKEVMKIKTHSAEHYQEQCITDRVVEELILPEDQKIGKIDIKIFKQYLILNGGIARFVLFVLLAMFFWISFKTGASMVMQIWCQNPIGQNIDLYIYVALNILSNIFVFIRCYTMMISATQQGSTVHKSMIKGLLYASLSKFYNRVPIGRIVNRLTKDLRELDQAITDSLSYVLISGFQILSTLTVCIYASSVLAIIPMILVGYFSIRLRSYYLKTQRQMARFQKSTNSPVISGFMSTISGLSTIRAFGKQQQFTKRQIEYANQNKKVRLNKSGLQNWFALNLTYMSFFINMPCIAFCMFSNSSDPSLVGLLMIYALSLNDQIINNILALADFQTKLISLERIYTFMNIQPEKDYIEYCRNWTPQQQGFKNIIKNGKIQFKNLHARYRADLPDVLHQVSCQIVPGQKIGIVGRTGAGKTTIINTLLRITDISKGTLKIDEVSLLEYPLKDLRNAITMIDQEPTLIKSTFRQNLDFTRRYTDQQLLNILKQCNLYDIITEKGGLDGSVSNTSLSAGEKQLLCICRAFLKNSKIVLIDEATANIDVKNDSLIQNVIADKFKNSTVLTIAHRLSTLKNSDKIMVMEKGELVQFGTPTQLQQREGGFYSEMLRKNVKDLLV